ncbi:exodeoxyribonuclease VII small subunit [Barnesiella sp. An55]|uniref:exodeoxyribonuclease VII small subunit n=1 Tax=Barnesiella sp. An55 TaxID=1965646 RepID=UPI000B3729D0|nr:exodeoxyribonuclease VII small subunit [Barnesiella sp. An55]OUN72615.1 exodeoxyribonuclease VII small subunit [Barnesiella sp. An55]HIZ26713.1 exodeoxyribonuclease VII small subunit [Candidatus Barnesiella merdipullorum]
MPQKKELSYAEAMAELESIVTKLQNNEYEIDELQKCTARSLELLKFCKSKLFETDEALQKILNELND